MILKETYSLANGVKIPKIGLGTWQIPDGEAAYGSVMAALVTVEDIRLHKLKLLKLHKVFFHHILDILDKQSRPVAACNVVHYGVYLGVVNSVLEVNSLVGFFNCYRYLAPVEIARCAVTFNNFHLLLPQPLKLL